MHMDPICIYRFVFIGLYVSSFSMVITVFELTILAITFGTPAAELSATRHFAEFAVAEAASNACSMLAAVDFGTFVGWDPSCTSDLRRLKNVVKSWRINALYLTDMVDRYSNVGQGWLIDTVR